MIPMTPSGARTRSTRRPLGRTHPSTTSPTGSARAATLRRPSAMPCNRPSTRRRSREVASAPDSSARRTSVALASRIRSACTPSRSAARSRASSRAAEDDRDSTRPAATVRRARSIIAGEGVDVTVSAYFPGFAPRRAEHRHRLLFPAGCSDGQARLAFGHRVLLTAPVDPIVEWLRTRTTSSYGKDRRRRCLRTRTTSSYGKDRRRRCLRSVCFGQLPKLSVLDGTCSVKLSPPADD